MTTINVISDLHLEKNNELDFSAFKFKDADVLAILGDFTPYIYLEDVFINKQINYLKQNVFPKYKRVYFVLGNHDYYGLYPEAVLAYKKHFSDVENLRVLENEFELFDDTIFVGASLWTDFNNNNPIDKLAIQYGLPDYSHIFISRYYKNIPIIPEYILKSHYESKFYIEYVSRAYPDSKIVVLTHHAPSLKCLNPKYKRSLINHGFASDLDNFIGTHSNIALWAYGHTHYDRDFLLHDTRIYSHQCGYQVFDTSLYHNFKPDKIITV